MPIGRTDRAEPTGSFTARDRRPAVMRTASHLADVGSGEARDDWERLVVQDQPLPVPSRWATFGLAAPSSTPPAVSTEPPGISPDQHGVRSAAHA